MNYSSPAFEVDYSLERDGNTVSVSGTILNRLEREVGTALLSFHFYDAEEVRVCQEQLFVNEIEPQEKVRFTGAVVLGGAEVASVRLVKADPIPLGDYPEVASSGDEAR